MLLDYRKAQEEEELYKTLSIKANKQPENKKIKSNTENIFAVSNENKPMKETKQKTLQELLVPEQILTVKGLRKC